MSFCFGKQWLLFEWRVPVIISQLEDDQMVGPGGMAGHDYYTRKNLKKNLRFLICASIIVGIVLYFWAR